MALVLHNHFYSAEDATTFKTSVHEALKGSSAYVDSQIAICDGDTDEDFYLIVGESNERELSKDLYLWEVKEPGGDMPGVRVLQKLIRSMEVKGPTTHHMLARAGLAYALRELFYFPDCEDIDTPLGAAYLIEKGIAPAHQGYLIRKSVIDSVLFPRQADRDFAMLIADCSNDIDDYLQAHVVHKYNPWDAVNALTREEVADLAKCLWFAQQQAEGKTSNFS